MKDYIKFALAMILCFGAFFAMTGCVKDDGIKVTSLSEYTIVYPSGYSEWKMEEVNFLKNVLSNVTKTEVRTIPDTEEATGKEIILASSSRTTAFDEKINGFANAMCYVVGVDGDNIVLGGQNFYSDMRAIYDFVNNYVGYNDFTDELEEAKEKIAGEKIVLWEKPKFYIMGSNFSVDAYTAPWQIKDFADCNFNLMQIVYANYSDEHTERDVAKWCARFGVEMMLLPMSDFNEKQVILRHEEDLMENPAMWGLYIVDEPAEGELCQAYSEILTNAKEKFGKYGWKCYVNIAGFGATPESEEDGGEFSEVTRWKTYFGEGDALSIDWYVNRFANPNDYICYAWETWRDLAELLDQEYYIYIDAYNLKNRGGNTKKMFRSHMYLALSFNADMAAYFQYGDASKNYFREGDWSKGSLINYDYSKNDYYYDAQKANAEVLKITDILDDYNYLGTFTENPVDYEIAQLKNPYTGFADVVSVKNNNENILLFACYEKKDGNGKAFLMTNLKTISDFDEVEKYEVISVESSKFIKKTGYDGKSSFEDWKDVAFDLKINAEKVTCYKHGEPIELTKNDDGTFSMISFDGDCYLFVIE